MALACWAAGGVGGALAAVCDADAKGGEPCFQLAGGVRMPMVAMGTWAGSYKDCGHTDFTCIRQHARFAADTWLHKGGTHLDAANDYRTQTEIADSLRASGLRREDVFITTKCPGAMGYEATIQCADDNLQMLGQFGTSGVAYIDLLLVHFPFTIKPQCRFHRELPECADNMTLPASKQALADTWRAMEDLIEMGVVRSIGVSNYMVEHLEATLANATRPIEVNQVEWHPMHHQEELLDFCNAHGILLEAYSPLGGAGGSVLSNPVVKEIAAAHNASAPQAVLRWSLQRGVAVVVGTANADHMVADRDIFSFQLTADEVNRMSAIQDGGAVLV